MGKYFVYNPLNSQWSYYATQAQMQHELMNLKSFFNEQMPVMGESLFNQVRAGKLLQQGSNESESEDLKVMISILSAMVEQLSDKVANPTVQLVSPNGSDSIVVNAERVLRQAQKLVEQ